MEAAITVVASSPQHHGPLGELTVAAYRAVDRSIDDDGYVDELADVAARAAIVPVLVALDGGRLLGGVSYVPGPGTAVSDFDDPDAAGIRHLAVDPAAQGRGAGRALVEACLARARADGRHRVLLHTLGTMTGAQALYRSLGFERDPSLDRWWGAVQGLGYRLELR